MWIVEANVFVFSSVRRSIVGDVEDEIEMIWIGSDVCGVWSLDGLDGDDGNAGVESEVSWILVWK